MRPSARGSIVAMALLVVAGSALAQPAPAPPPPPPPPPPPAADPGAQPPPPPAAAPGAQPAAPVPPPPPPPPPAGDPGAQPPPPAGAQPGTQPPPGYPPPGYYYPPPPGAYVEPAPPPPPPDRGEHLHDGFYLRLSLGAGMIQSDWQTESSGVDNISISGGGLAFDFLLGGSPADGLVIGGGMLLNTAQDPEAEPENGPSTEVAGDLGTGLLGVFVDGFFDPTGGFHLGGMLGIASYSLQSDDGEDFEQGGAGVAVWVGYDAWVGSQWSIGPLLRLTGQTTREEKEGIEEQVSAGTVSLLFTALYH